MISKLRNLTLIQKIFIGGIIFLAIIIAVYGIFMLNISRRHSAASQVDTQLAALATTYYENYFYPTLESSIHANSTASLSQTLSQYTDTGFARVPLRQILLHTTHSAEATSTIRNLCDENSTFVHFFPEPPFTASSYHITYDYSCNF